MGFDPPLALLVVLQLLHALTFGATHIGAVHFISRAVPETQSGTAQALYAAVTGGIVMGGTMLAAGPLYAAYGGRAYWAMAAVAVWLPATALVAAFAALALYSAVLLVAPGAARETLVDMITFHGRRSRTAEESSSS